MDENNLTPWGAMVNAVKDGREEGSSNTTEPSAADVAGPTPVLQQQITPEMVAAGYQPGMTAQQITIGNEGKGPKVPMIIASILVVIGLVGFGIGAVVGASIEDTFTVFNHGLRQLDTSMKTVAMKINVVFKANHNRGKLLNTCLLYTSPSPRDS